MTIRSDEPLSAGSGPGPDGGRGPAHEAGAADAVAGPSASGSGGAAVSSSGVLGGGAVGDPPSGGLGRGTASSPAGLDDGPRADGASADDQSADDPVGGLPTDSPVDGLPDGGPVDDGGGMSPVVREYVERLRSEALARDAQLRARGIDPYKGAGVDEGPRRRLGARVLVVLVVLVTAVSVGAYVVFFRGEADYGMSHGYQVQSDGSLKRPPVTDKAPEQPAEMSKGDEAGAEAAARYYLKASAYAWTTGDTELLKAICDQNCVHCQNAITKVEKFYAHGYWATGGYNDVTETQIVERLENSEYGPGAYAVQLRFDEHLAEGYTSNGFKDRATYDTIILIHVWWDGSSWRVMKGAAEDAEDVK